MKAENEAVRPKFYRTSVRVPQKAPFDDEPVEDYWRPTHRYHCYDHKIVPRPCPFVGCVFNLFCDVDESTGSLVLNAGTNDPTIVEESCSCVLDVVEQNGYSGLTLEEVGVLMHVTRERVRQLEQGALKELKAAMLEEAVFEDD